jgi:hypothetical protein
MPASPNSDLSCPDLRIVPTGNIIRHEFHDDQRLEPLVRAIKADSKLKNPPLVAGLGDDRLVVLDGANRVTALGKMGIPHCLVQVVPYTLPFVELYTWHHAVADIDIAELDARIAAIDGLTVGKARLIRAQATLARRVLLGYYIRRDGTVATLASDDNDLHTRTHLLNQVVNIYLTGGRLHRTNSEDIEELKSLYPNLAALMIFPNYTPAEVLELAGDEAKLPPGLTRHIIHGRALRVNYPLDHLRADDNLASKNAALKEWVQSKLDKRHVRFYAESTILFDE